MGRSTHTDSEFINALRTLALSYPETVETTACNKAAFKARNKGFLFLGIDDAGCNVMLKLAASIPEATKLAKGLGCCKVGANGWVTATFRHDQAPPPGLLERWIDESYRLLAPKQLAALLTESKSPAKDIGKSTRERKTARKNATSR